MNAPEPVIRTTLPQSLQFHELAKLLPYAAPWLQIDRVVNWSQDGIVVEKALSGGDINMSAHLKQGPSIVPGVLQIEMVNQATMLLMTLLNVSGQRADDVEGAGVMARVKATFHSPAYIGEVLRTSVRVVEVVNNKTMYEGEVKVGDRLVSTVQGMGALIKQMDTAPAA